MPWWAQRLVEGEGSYAAHYTQPGRVLLFVANRTPAANAGAKGANGNGNAAKVWTMRILKPDGVNDVVMQMDGSEDETSPTARWTSGAALILPCAQFDALATLEAIHKERATAVALNTTILMPQNIEAMYRVALGRAAHDRLPLREGVLCCVAVVFDQ